MNRKIQILKAHGFVCLRAIYFGGVSTAVYIKPTKGAVHLIQKDGDPFCWTRFEPTR